MINNSFLDEFIDIVNQSEIFSNFKFATSKEGYSQYFEENDNSFGSVILTGDDTNSIGFGLSIAFKSIESLITKPKIENWLDDRYDISVRMYEHSACTGYEFFKGFKEELPIKINSKETLKRAVELAKIAFEQDIKPFFDYWSSIIVFLPWLQTEKYDDWPALYKVLGPTFLEKKMIIWYQTNHPEYEDFKNFNLDRFQKRITDSSNENPEKTKKILIGLNELITRLEKTEHIYKWDNSYLKAKPFKGQLPLI